MNKRLMKFRSEVFIYYATSNGTKRIYRDIDRVPDHGSSRIFCPSQVSLINLFVNGVLQSPRSYVVKPVPTSQGYYNLYVNGVLQQAGLSTLTATNLVVQAAILLGVTVVIEIVDLAATSSSSSTNNITVSTTINT